MEKRTIYDKKLFNFPLRSEKLNLQTVVDCILINSAERIAVPMQFKYGKAPSCLYKTMKYQIVAEALLIEECLGFSCPYGLVKFLPEGRTFRTELGVEQKQELLSQLTEISDVVRFERYPCGPRTQNFCTDCCYRGKVCGGFDGWVRREHGRRI
jgi:CRISPR/Cas system-associated exonuclease Cas4 (RecB family)